jgi:hypothetical protein
VELGAPSWGGGDTSITSLNGKFDSALAQNGIYQFMWHPQVLYPDLNLPYLKNHLTYISNRNNIWYANLGHIYLYHAMQGPLTAPVFTVVKDNNNSPAGFSLSQNYPNPFNPSTNIKYNISKAGYVSLKVYDILGREVASLVNEYKNAGMYTVNFTNLKLTSGVYIDQLKTNEYVINKKMILMK